MNDFILLMVKLVGAYAICSAVIISSLFFWEKVIDRLSGAITHTRFAYNFIFFYQYRIAKKEYRRTKNFRKSLTKVLESFEIKK